MAAFRLCDKISTADPGRQIQLTVADVRRLFLDNVADADACYADLLRKFVRSEKKRELLEQQVASLHSIVNALRSKNSSHLRELEELRNLANTRQQHTQHDMTQLVQSLEQQCGTLTQQMVGGLTDLALIERSATKRADISRSVAALVGSSTSPSSLPTPRSALTTLGCSPALLNIPPVIPLLENGFKFDLIKSNIMAHWKAGCVRQFKVGDLTLTVCTYHYDSFIRQHDFAFPLATQVGEASSSAASNTATWRRECRGLTFTGDKLVARPLPKFFSIGQVPDYTWAALGEFEVLDATLKLDGALMFALVLEGKVLLLTKGGVTTDATQATSWLHKQLDCDYGGLINTVCIQHNSTPCFEWVGPHSAVKVNYRTNLILTSCRYLDSGLQWPFSTLEAVATPFKVPVVSPIPMLVGKVLWVVHHMVTHWVGVEGVVLRLSNGSLVKVKTNWWKQKELVPKARRPKLTPQQQPSSIHHKALRAIVHGLGKAHPSELLTTLQQCHMVELLHTPNTLKGTVIVTFKTTTIRDSYITGQLKSQHLIFKAANSNRTSENRSKGQVVSKWVNES